MNDAIPPRLLLGETNYVFKSPGWGLAWTDGGVNVHRSSFVDLGVERAEVTGRSP